MLNDPLANVMSNIRNRERLGKKDCKVHPVSKLIKQVLGLLQEEGFLGAFEEIQKEKGGEGKVHLLGNINDCGVVKPRYAVKIEDVEKFEKRYLPGKNVGVLIMTTSKGVMTHNEAKKQHVGGKLIAYCY